MDIASLATVMSQAETQQTQAIKISSMVKDQTEATGAQAIQLIESASARPVDPSSPIGQNIDTFA